MIAPWNFPLYLALGPLAVALAAGNRVMIKMPRDHARDQRDAAPHAGRVLQRRRVALVGEELEDRERLHLPALRPHRVHRLAGGRQDRDARRRRQPDAGDARAGRQVARPSCCPTTDVREAAIRIAHGKAINGGQICVAPDYALVPRAKVGIRRAREEELPSMYGPRIAGQPRLHLDRRRAPAPAHPGAARRRARQGRRPSRPAATPAGPPDAAAHRDQRDAGHAPDAGRDLRPHPAGGRLRRVADAIALHQRRPAPAGAVLLQPRQRRRASKSSRAPTPAA